MFVVFFFAFFFGIPVVLTLPRVSYELYLEQRALKPADLSKQGKNAAQLEAKIERKNTLLTKTKRCFLSPYSFILTFFFSFPLFRQPAYDIFGFYFFSLLPSFIFHIHFCISLSFFELPPLIY